MQTIDLTPVLQAVISLAAVLITALLIPWLKTKLSLEQQQKFAAVVRTLVYAAEQIYSTEKSGSNKLAYVKRELESRGYTVDEAVIEAAVRELASIGAEHWADLEREAQEPPDDAAEQSED